jgi:hypothetical protein
MSMQTYLQGRIDLVKALRASSLPFISEDLELILTAVMSACAACRWPGKGFDRNRFVESLIQFGSPELHLDYVSTGALLEIGVISDRQTPWSDPGKRLRIFRGEEIDGPISAMAKRYPTVTTLQFKQACYANRIYEWLRCGYAHTYLAAGNTTSVQPSDLPAQISYITERAEDGSLARVAKFHLDYLIDVAQGQVSTLPKAKLLEPPKWWIDRPE